MGGGTDPPGPQCKHLFPYGRPPNVRTSSPSKAIEAPGSVDFEPGMEASDVETDVDRVCEREGNEGWEKADRYLWGRARDHM